MASEDREAKIQAHFGRLEITLPDGGRRAVVPGSKTCDFCMQFGKRTRCFQFPYMPNKVSFLRGSEVAIVPTTGSIDSCLVLDAYRVGMDNTAEQKAEEMEQMVRGYKNGKILVRNKIEG